MGSVTRLVLGGLAGVALASGLLIGLELLDAPQRLLDASAYDATTQFHTWISLAFVAALPVLATMRWAKTEPPGSRPRTLHSHRIALTALPAGCVGAMLRPGLTLGLGFALAAFGVATLLGAGAIGATERRAALRWAGVVLLGAGLLHASLATGIDSLVPWAERSRGWVLRAIIVGLPLATALRHVQLSKPTRGLLAGALLAFTIAGGPLQPLRVMCAALVFKTWRSATPHHDDPVARTWLLGATGLLLVSECGAAVIGLDDPFVAFTYVPVAQIHYVAAAGFAATVGVVRLETRRESGPGVPGVEGRTRGGRACAIVFLVGAHLGCGALLLLGRAGMPRLFAAYLPAFEPLFRIAAAGAVVALLAAGCGVWSSTRRA